MIYISGLCPMGCGDTLLVNDEYRISCYGSQCPRPSAADEILSEPTAGHIMETNIFRYDLIHPLRERLDQQLLQCELSRYLDTLESTPVSPGRYQVTGSGTDWHYESL